MGTTINAGVAVRGKAVRGFHAVSSPGMKTLLIGSAVSVVLLGVAVHFGLLRAETALFGAVSGALVLAAVGMRAARQADYVSAQLTCANGMLAQEARLRKQAEDACALTRTRLDLLDAELPAMVAYADRQQHYVYHNRAFREWLGLAPEQVDGRHMREVLGDDVYAEIGAAIAEACDGNVVRYDRTHKMAGGAIYRLSVQLIPHFGPAGKVAGIFAMLTDITDRNSLQAITGEGLAGTADAREHSAARPEPLAHNASAEQTMYVNSFTENATGWQNAAGRIVRALERDEFRLFGQFIAPMSDAIPGAHNCEILLRLLEEEENLMPPGAFISIAEQYGLMPHVDRWVLRQALRWAAGLQSPVQVVMWLNLSRETLGDPDFVAFVDAQLRAHRLPSSVLCFEIEESELESTHGDAAQFIRKVRDLGCRASVSSFGRESVSFELLKSVRLDFLKIDGNLVLDLLRNPLSVARVAAINRVAHAIGINTVAELVESDEVMRRLRQLGTDFGQGFGISVPVPLEEIKFEAPASVRAPGAPQVDWSSDFALGVEKGYEHNLPTEPNGFPCHERAGSASPDVS